MYSTDSCKKESFQSFFYEGVTYKAHNTRVFAYYKTPIGVPPPGGWPAVICAHGGGGTAFPEWVDAWVRRGYAAIAMDLEGHLPTGIFPNRQWHEYAGPPRITTFGDIELADREQWFYHAVADVIKASSLLASFPEINKHKIGIHGISWGGVITSAVIGIDHRLAFAIPVYGCGFLYETSCFAFKKYFDVMTESQLKAYKSKWDPSLYLPACNIPTLFYVGTNDGAFPLDIWQKSALLVKGKRMFCIPVSNEHGHIWNQEEIFAFADAVVNEHCLLHIEEPQVNRDSVTVKVSQYAGKECTSLQLKNIQLVYTEARGNWQMRKWQSIRATMKAGNAVSALPSSATAFFFSITDDRGLTFNSPYATTNLMVERN